jgi:Holliday junction resolvasome RuvABC ATP-dependent DNA helicase subunit
VPPNLKADKAGSRLLPPVALRSGILLLVLPFDLQYLQKPSSSISSSSSHQVRRLDLAICFAMLEQVLLRARHGEAQLPHILLIGSSARDRAAVSGTICNKLRLAAIEITCSQLRTCDHLAAQLIVSNSRVFFMDWIERLSCKLGETLRLALKENYVPIVIEEWGILRNAEAELRPFTMIAGVETEAQLPERFVSEFPVKLYLF